jgi:hypothetical protein
MPLGDRTRRLPDHRDPSCPPKAGTQHGVWELGFPLVHGTRLHPLLLAPMWVSDPGTLTRLQRLPLMPMAVVFLVAQ